MAANFFTPGGDHRFPPTRRSAVLGVGSGDPVERARAFDVLVRVYWKPVYKHLRVRWNRPPEDGRDLTQAFFAKAFEKRYFADYEPAKALFRTYLKTCLDRFVQDALRDERRQKRGGEVVRLRLDFDVADAELARAGPQNHARGEACFDTEWMRNLLASSVEAMEAACAECGKGVYFDVFRRYDLEPDENVRADGDAPPDRAPRRPSYAALADQLGLSVNDITNYLAWSRREFRRVVLAKLREVTATEQEFRSEARALFGKDP